jgi:hypothetical protein
MGTSARRPKKPAVKPRNKADAAKDASPRKRRPASRPKKSIDGTPVPETKQASDAKKTGSSSADATLADVVGSKFEPIHADALAIEHDGAAWDVLDPVAQWERDEPIGDATSTTPTALAAGESETPRESTGGLANDHDQTSWPVLDPVERWEREFVEPTGDLGSTESSGEMTSTPESDTRPDSPPEPPPEVPAAPDHQDGPRPLRPERAWALALARMERENQAPDAAEPPHQPDTPEVAEPANQPDTPEVAEPPNQPDTPEEAEPPNQLDNPEAAEPPNQPDISNRRDPPDPPWALLPAEPEPVQAIEDGAELPVDDWPWEQPAERVAALHRHGTWHERRRAAIYRGGLAAAIIAVAVGSIGIVAVALNAIGQRGGATTPTLEVAAATDVPATSDVPATTIIEESFDALPMDSDLGAGWVVSGGGGASVVALPTSVDRSVRIRSSMRGEAASACRAVDQTAVQRVSFDLFIGRLPPSTAAVASVRSGDRDLLTLAVDPSGSLTSVAGPGSPASSPGPDGARSGEGWGRVELRIDAPGGSIEWQAHDVTGAEIGSGASEVVGLTGALVDGVCFRSPDGMPSGWIAIDDLLIEG